MNTVSSQRSLNEEKGRQKIQCHSDAAGERLDRQLLALKVQRDYTLRICGTFLKAGKGKDIDSSLALLDGTQPCQHMNFTQ